MRKIAGMAVFAAILSVGALLRADDTVILTDGTVLQGQVMQETSDEVVLSDHGVQRTLQRGLVAKVEFNTSPASSDSSPATDSAPADGGDTVPSAPSGEVAAPSDGGDTVPALPTQDQTDYVDGVSAYYDAPSDQVWDFEQQGIPYEELPVVFYVASRAQCDPAEVVGLRLQGRSWADICRYLGLGPGIFYWRGFFSVDLGGPYSEIYFGFRRYPRDLWNWDVLSLSDSDIINCVNMRFSTAYWRCTPYEVAHWRVYGHPYFWGGFYVHGSFIGTGRVWGGYHGHGGYAYYGASNHGGYGVHSGYGSPGYHAGYNVHGAYGSPGLHAGYSVHGGYGTPGYHGHNGHWTHQHHSGAHSGHLSGGFGGQGGGNHVTGVGQGGGGGNHIGGGGQWNHN